jgi:hypothetical protein
LHPHQLLGRLQIDGVEAAGKEHAVQAVFRRRSGNPADVLDVLVGAKPAGNVNPAQWQGFFGWADNASQKKKGESKSPHMRVEYITQLRSEKGRTLQKRDHDPIAGLLKK